MPTQPVSDGPRYVILESGLALPVAPILLLIDLERRGFLLSRDGDDILTRPASKLTPDDVAQMKLWKQHLLVLVDYEAQVRA